MAYKTKVDHVIKKFPLAPCYLWTILSITAFGFSDSKNQKVSGSTRSLNVYKVSKSSLYGPIPILHPKTSARGTFKDRVKCTEMNQCARS